MKDKTEPTELELEQLPPQSLSFSIKADPLPLLAIIAIALLTAVVVSAALACRE